uniref:Uncharacterized protein n=1 Tax=Anguilla anguilla TaxID=7936 RepID=A0A0E9XS88_ANGAN
MFRVHLKKATKMYHCHLRTALTNNRTFAMHAVCFSNIFYSGYKILSYSMSKISYP